MKKLFNIFKGLLLFGAISNTLYVMSITAKNIARKCYLEEKYKGCEAVPDLKSGWTIIEAMKNFKKVIWYMDKI